MNLSLRALWNYKSSATYKDLATPAGLHPTVVSQALSSARDVGLTEYAGKRGLYTFTPQGKEYTRALTGGAESEAKDRLRQIILTNPRWVGIVAFLRTNVGVPRPNVDLVLDVERRLSKQWSSGMRTNVAQSLVSILEFAGLAMVESGRIISTLRPDFEGERLVADHRASVKDFSVPQPYTWAQWSVQEAQRRAAERMEPPKPDFAEFKDENVVIRVRKDLQSIAFAKGFLDYVESVIRLNAQAKKDTPATESGSHVEGSKT
jgi:hypothetical protein